MSRQRSPSYPNISLPEAIDLVRKVFSADRQAPLERAVIAKHIGYSGTSGAADKTIGSLMQYGLLERVAKGEIRVSPRAIGIFHPHDVQERRKQLVAAAYSPDVFQQLRERFGFGKVPSIDAATSFLIRGEYLDRAIGPIISAYADTCLFLEREGASENVGPSDDLPKESPDDEADHAAGDALAARFDKARERVLSSHQQWPITSGPSNQRVLIKGILSKGATFEIIVSGAVGQKEIDTLIRKLEIDKEILADDSDMSDIA